MSLKIQVKKIGMKYALTYARRRAGSSSGN